MTTPFKAASDTFFESTEGQRCCDIQSLGGKEGMRFYLENRLKEAFRAGWNAHEASSASGDTNARP